MPTAYCDVVDLDRLADQCTADLPQEPPGPACAGCHGPTGAGIPAQYPRIGGQHQDYTVAQLALFKTGARANSPQMSTIAKRMSDEEMKAVADYIAGLK